MKKLLVVLVTLLASVCMAEDVGTQSLIDSAVTHDKLYSGVEKYQDTAITNAQILAMTTTPITVVTAPATGYANVLTGGMLWVTTGTTTFNLMGSLVELRYTNASGSKVSGDMPAAVVESASSTYQYFPGVSVVPVSVAAIVIRHGASVGFTTVGASGNSWKVRAFYRSLKVNPLSSY